jgi:hypothetical protein
LGGSLIFGAAKGEQEPDIEVSTLGAGQVPYDLELAGY